MRQQCGTANPGTSRLKAAQPRLRGLAGKVAMPGYAAMLAWLRRTGWGCGSRRQTLSGAHFRRS